MGSAAVTKKVEKKILMIGAYGAGNLGDDAILQGMLIVLEEERGIPKEDITVYSYDPKETTRQFEVSAIQRDDTQDLPTEYDKLLVGGGGIIYGGNAPLYCHRLEEYLKLGKKVEVYGIGTDRLGESGTIVKDVFNQVDPLSVRTAFDKENLKGVGVTKEIKVVDCPSFLVPTPPKEEITALLGKYFNVAAPLLGICLKPRMIGNKIKPSFLRFLRERFLPSFTFVPLIMCKHRSSPEEADEIPLRALFEKLELMDGLEEWFNLKVTPSVMKGIVQNMNHVITNRKHPLMFAAQKKIPVTVVEDTPSFILSSYARCYGIHSAWIW